MAYDPTPQQRAIGQRFQTRGQPRRSLIVEACAGAGKTTTLLESVLSGDDPSTLICAFNKRIQLDMEAKLARRPVRGRRAVHVKTLHALGLSVLKTAWGSVNVDAKANDGLIRECYQGAPRWRYHAARMLTYCKDVHPRIWMEPIEALVRVCYNQITDPRILEQPTVVHDIAAAVQQAMRRSCVQRPTIDFSDMVWAPIVLELPPPGRYTRVVVDEAQDMSAAQLELIERFVAPGGSIVVVGDLHQGIYQFRGADGRAIWEALKTKHAAEVLPLTVSWRCAQAVIAEAKRIVPVIEARPGAPLGTVDTIASTDLLKQARPGDFILSRTNGALVSLAIDLYVRGAKPRIEGGSELLEPLLLILEKLSTRTPETYANSLRLWYLEQTKRADQAGNTDEWTDRVEDWFVMLAAVGARASHPTQVGAMLRAIFEGDADRQALSLSTIHKAKGLEARRVFLLRQSFRRYRKPHDPDAPPYVPTQEELNIEYVGITRAIEHLTWVDLELPTTPSKRTLKPPPDLDEPDPDDRDDDEPGLDEQHALAKLVGPSLVSPPLRRQLADLERERQRQGIPSPRMLRRIQDGMEGFVAALDDIGAKHEPGFPTERGYEDDDENESEEDRAELDDGPRFPPLAPGQSRTPPGYQPPTHTINLGYGGEGLHDHCDCETD